MDRSVKAPGQNSLSEWKEVIAVGAVTGVAEAAGLSIRVGEALYGTPQEDVPWNPVSLALQLVVTGETEWTGAATGGAVTLAAGTALGVAASIWSWRRLAAKYHRLAGRRGRIRREKIDAQARYMARGKELRPLARSAMAAKAAELGVELGDSDAPGVLVGRVVADGQPLYGSYEDLHLDIWGPRQGKSSSRVIPAVMEAIGPVVATSNKRDVVDATRAARAEFGRVWVFDPQGVASEECTWYWDPIEWVAGHDGGARAQERAAELAGHFAAGDDGDKRDAFFEPEAEDLLAGLFLAAALLKEPVTTVWTWITDPDHRTHLPVVEQAFPMVAAGLAAQYSAPDKQRAGIFGTAKKMASCLKYARIAPWVTPPTRGQRPKRAFDVHAFATSRDTLFPLSLERKGTAGPLITALAAAVADAAAEAGTRRPGGRLAVPMLIVLDEAANIVRWRDLPKQYSHFGSRGIVVMTVLQSWAQGCRCWGTDGMTALWSAANIKVLGSGLDDYGFLRDRSELIGSHYERVTSTSRSHGGGPGSRSISTQRVTEQTLTASDLAALPRGRCVVFSSGHRPTLVAPVPWWERPYGPQIKAALTAAAATPETATQAGRGLYIVPPPVDTDEEGHTA